jgi:hypothetical protein
MVAISSGSQDSVCWSHIRCGVYAVTLLVAGLCLLEILLVTGKNGSMTDQDKKRYVRWQKYRITQFSFAINLFLSFAVAGLGFCLNLMKDSGLTPPIEAGCLLHYAVFSLVGSIGFGSLATLCRLWDFRCTAVEIKKKYEDWRQNAAEFLAKWLGCVSWSLFYLQLAALAYGAFFLISAVMAVSCDKFVK